MASLLSVPKTAYDRLGANIWYRHVTTLLVAVTALHGVGESMRQGGESTSRREQNRGGCILVHKSPVTLLSEHHFKKLFRLYNHCNLVHSSHYITNFQDRGGLGGPLSCKYCNGMYMLRYSEEQLDPHNHSLSTEQSPSHIFFFLISWLVMTVA